MNEPLFRVAVPAPFAGPLDYLPPTGEIAMPGARVQVPLGRRKTVGIVLGEATSSTLEKSRLRRIISVLDHEALLPAELIGFIEFAARYYHYPIGEAFAAVLPGPLRRGRPAQPPTQGRYRLVEASDFEPRSAGQVVLLERLSAAGQGGLVVAEFNESDRARLRRLVARGVVEPVSGVQSSTRPTEKIRLNAAQLQAADALTAALDAYAAFVLEGVTGSGKTEVYLAAIRAALARERQALVIVPEIALTPQLVTRFEAALGMAVATYHSGLADGERLRVWLAARANEAPVIIGTRSAVFLPLVRPGLIVVDEEHDSSLKQQDGFRYHARDLAVYRAHANNCPVVLGSATPSFESLANVRTERYRHLVLPERAGDARPPTLKRVDVRGQRMEAGLSNALLDAIAKHLDAGDQVLIFLNRRGFAPIVLCNACGEPLECKRCSARLTWHRGRARLICHHCGAEKPLPELCPECGANELIALGKGTERLEDVLVERFPNEKVLRVDRDSTRRRGQLAALMDEAASGRARILVGTQMLAKGHDFKALTLVAVVDADQGLYGADFRAPERMAQLITQVAGRAGRGEKPGEVMIQTRHPDHPLLLELLRHGYAGFAQRELDEREAAGLPPYGALALLRAEAAQESAPQDFLAAAAKLFVGVAGVRVMGPAPAPMLRRAGRFRYQLLLEARDRPVLQNALAQHYPKALELRAARRVRIALDVDPADLT